MPALSLSTLPGAGVNGMCYTSIRLEVIMSKFPWVGLALAVVVACGGDQEERASTGPAESESVEEAQQLEGEELAAALNDANVFLLDVRNPEELEELGTVAGYVNIPIDELADRLDELPKDKPILTA